MTVDEKQKQNRYIEARCDARAFKRSFKKGWFTETMVSLVHYFELALA